MRAIFPIAWVAHVSQTIGLFLTGTAKVAGGKKRTLTLRMLLLLTVCLTITSQASALTIIGNYIEPGQAFPWMNETPPTAQEPNAITAGGGDFMDIFNAAADMWERAILDDHQVTIHFGWDGLPGTVRGTHFLIEQGGSPNRETEGVIVFDNSTATEFEKSLYMDPDPYDYSEYDIFVENEVNLGGGLVNTERYFRTYEGDPVFGTDFFTLALHEIGHGLGLSAFNSSFTEDSPIVVTDPLPFAGSVIPTMGSHLFVEEENYGQHISAMCCLGVPGVRQVLSEADILAEAQISQFSNLTLNPLEPVPAPSTLLLLGTGLVGLVGLKRRFRK